MVPALNPDYAAAGILDPEARDMDVDALFQGYLRGYRERGGELIVDAPVHSLEQKCWRLAHQCR